MRILLCDALGVGTCRSLLSCAWSQAVVVVVLAWTQASLASLVALGATLTLAATHGLATAHHVAGGLDCVVLLHLVVEGSGSDGAARLEDSKLLLVKDLGVREALVCIRLTEVRRAHNLLRHHQVVCLGSVDSFLALDSSDSELRIL